MTFIVGLFVAVNILSQQVSLSPDNVSIAPALYM